jgi:uncharacterized surface protein with fasciclin (FAS1) repeats
VRSLTIFTILAALLVFAGCSNDITTPAAPTVENPENLPPAPPGEGETLFSTAKAEGDIVDTAINAGFGTLVDAVIAADLVGALQDDGPLTVFAPTDEAFGELPADLVAKLFLPEYKDKLAQILTYHVVAGKVTSGDLRFYQRVPTLEGSELSILKFWRLIKVNDARVTLADVLATNGVIHVINKVLIPEGFTLDDPAEPTQDIVDIATGGDFPTLVDAVIAAGLVETLRQEGLTVFAPNEAAFANLPAETVAALFDPNNKELLVDLLAYHVIPSEVRSSDLRRWQIVKMFNGGYTLVRKTYDGQVLVNRSRVVAADVLATNGVIHVIDRVLIPLSFYGNVPGLGATPPADHPELEMELSAFGG